MKHITARIINISIIVLLLAGLLSWPEPAAAGVSEWSAETIPSVTDNVIGPAGIDIRDYVIGNDNKIIYAVAGDSIAGNVVFKSIDAGVKWTSLPVSARADLIAVAPDDNNFVVYANRGTPELFLSINGGTTWNTMSTVAGNPSPPAAVAIRDIAVSPLRAGKHYIAAAGQNATNDADIWYFPYGEVTPNWQATSALPGFTAQSNADALAFSPDFAGDAALVAVTDNVGVGVNLQVLSISLLNWNASAAYTGYPCTVNVTGLTAVTSASVTLAPTYDGTDEDTRNLFIGLTIEGDAAAIAASGIYRFKDTVKASIYTNARVHSVAFNGSTLLAGAYNAATVYRVPSALNTTWTVSASTATKTPGGDNCTLARWMGTTVTAGTGGNESAFSISKDSGATFNDISLIDTFIINARDVAVSASAHKVYLVTDDTVDTSVWYKTSNAWSRVLNLKNTTDCIVRTERVNASIVYVVKKGTNAIYTNTTSGAAQWLTRMCNINIQDIAVESATIMYVLDATGKVSKSSNAGIYWGAIIDTTLTSGNMLCSISAGKLLAGSQNGYVAYTLDSNVSWTIIPRPLSPLAGKIQVIADQSFATNNIIYAATQTPGQDIMKWQIGTSTAWADIFNGVVVGGIYGLAIDTNTLYALELNAGQSTLWRFIAPTNATATSVDWVGIGITPTTDPLDNPFSLNAEPQALKVSASKLWAVKTNTTPFSGNKLFSFTDAVTGITITLSSPPNGYVSGVNTINGLAYDIPLVWDRPSIATEYQVLISLDSDFLQPLTSITVNSTAAVVSAHIGPGQAGVRNINFMPGTTYYWKLRTTKPGYSLYSGVRSFSIEPISISSASSIQTLSPAPGLATTDTTPAFSWQPLAGATEYEFMISESPDMISPIADIKTGTTGLQLTEELEYGKTYFWQVRAISPLISDWSPLGTLMIAEPVTTEIIVETIVPAPILPINLPGAARTELLFPPPDPDKTRLITPGYLVAAIFIALLLTGTVTWLIFKRSPEMESSGAGVKGGRGVERRAKDGISKISTPAEKRPVPEKPAATGRPPTDKVAAPPETVKAVSPTVQKPPPPAAGKNKGAETVIFAAKSFMWMAADDSSDAEPVTEKEREALGKKLAARIQDLAKKALLYHRYPEDAAMLLQIWARYGTKKEAGRYLADSLKNRPENALKFIKIYLPAGLSEEMADAADQFNIASYNALSGVIEPDKVYAALTKIFKFKLDAVEETPQIKAGDRNIAFKFMRLHLQEKNRK